MTGKDGSPEASEFVVRSAETSDLQTGLTRGGEYTADLLPYFVCLLDGRGRIVRMNQAVEGWSLGSIAGVFHGDLHALLHSKCSAAPCQLAAAIADCWARLQRGDPCEVDLHDAAPERCLHLSAWPLPPAALAGEAPGDTWTAVVVVTLRRSAQEALRRSRNELAALSRGLLSARELERKGIARELHHSVGQSLSAIKYSLERGEELARRSGLPDLEHVLQRAIVDLLDVVEGARVIAMNLRPPVLDDFGAVSAVNEFCREFSRTHPTVALRTNISALDAAVPERLQTAVFRTAQQLLNNIARYADAHRVVVSLSQASDQLVLELIDDGVDVGMASEPSSSARRAILEARELAEMTGGRFSLRTGEAGLGTRVRIQWRVIPGEMIGSGSA